MSSFKYFILFSYTILILFLFTSNYVMSKTINECGRNIEIAPSSAYDCTSVSNLETACCFIQKANGETMCQKIPQSGNIDGASRAAEKALDYKVRIDCIGNNSGLIRFNMMLMMIVLSIIILW